MPLDAAGDVCGAVASFYRAVREGGIPYPSIADGARAVRVVFAAEDAARRGICLDVPVTAVPAATR